MANEKTENTRVDSFVDSELRAWIEERRSKMHEILTPLQEQIMRLRYGLEDGRPRTLAELSEQFGMTRERVRQIEALCLRKLRHPKNRV